MAKGKIKVGDRFGRLVTKYKIPYDKKNSKWHCECDCGNFVDVFPGNLLSGETVSCKCYTKEIHKKYNKYDLSREYGIGYASNGGEFYFDLEDYEKIKDYCWMISTNDGYVVTNIPNSSTLLKMHRFLLNINDKRIIDHKSRIKTDNRKENLRIATNSQNSMNCNLSKINTSGITGISWCESRGKWETYIAVDGERTRLGRFSDLETAIKSRLNAEKNLFGDFAPQRHLFKEYGIT
jgi:hypothetical protein